MSAAWYEWDWDYLWHVLGGAIIEAGIVWGLYLAPVPWQLSVFGIPIIYGAGRLREKSQHDWGKLTAHQELEAACWGIGAVAAFGGALLIL